MIFLSPLFTVFFLVHQSTAQVSIGTENVVLSGTIAPESSVSDFGGDLLPTGSEVSYISYSTTRTVDGSVTLLATSFANVNGSILFPSSTSSQSSSTTSFSILQGSVGASASSSGNSSISNLNFTSTSTTSSATATNTQACNNHPEFCERSYSNITFIAAHNSPFVSPNNAASNQILPVLDQLNDGIRMLQGQTHYNETTKTISYCHTSCNLLNAGTAESYFTTIAGWVREHPYDVITLLIGNADFVGVGNYTTPLENSGLAQYAYVPPKVPMGIDDWPTLSTMILARKRVVIFMDYNADQTEVPYILDEFSQMWETPFSPQNRTFPCTQQRPPGLSPEDAGRRMYMANHNLNTEISLAGISLLVPTTTLINETNAEDGFGSLGLMTNNCIAAWPRPPNFLLVDYYNFGNVPGSVFAVAAAQNNVTYSRPCCGLIPSAASSLQYGGLSGSFTRWWGMMITAGFAAWWVVVL